MKIITSERIPIKIWTDHVEDEALQQAKNLANLRFSEKWIAIMPDVHVGYGMPIGGILATKKVVVPNAVGVDIGCGMIARKTNLKDIDREMLKKILNQIQRDVPTGFSHHKKPQPVSIRLKKHMEKVLKDQPQLEAILKDVPFQLGTLGGGNHFIEIQKDDAGFIWIMLHSGSRGIGKKICDYYNRVAKKYSQNDPSASHDLAYLPIDSKQGQNYLTAMNMSLIFAEENRQLMLDKIITAFKQFYPDLKFGESIDTHHNYAAWENHQGDKLLIHRKGAVRAQGKVIIPGSMGSYSYIAQGLENPQSFSSCAHGAGRILGRKEAIRKFPIHQVLDYLQKKGIELYKQKKSDVAEEHFAAYKDLDQVMRDQQDLVKPEVKLYPIGVVKG